MRKLSLAVTIYCFFLAFSMLTIHARADSIVWSTPVQLTIDAADDYYASIMQDSSDKIWLVWANGDPHAGNLLYKTSSDGGLSWSTACMLVPDVCDVSGTSLLQDSSGRIWIAWASGQQGAFDIYYITSDNGGNSWSSTQRLTAYSGDDVNPSLIEVDSEVWVVFRSNGLSADDDIWYTKTSDVGTTWSDPTQLTSNPGPNRGPDAMVDSTGKIWVAWKNRNEDISFKTSIDKGVTWSPEAELAAHPAAEAHPSIIEDAFGKILVFYQRYEGTNNYNIVYKTTSDGGNTWSIEQLVTTGTYDNEVPCAALVKNGVWVTWSSNRSGNLDIWLSRMIQVLSATIDVDPDTLNLRSCDKWITGYFELPEDYDVNDISVPSIRLNGTIPVDPSAPVTIGDYDNDAVPDLMVKFDRNAVVSFIYNQGIRHGTVTLTVTGTLNDGTLFQGSDTIKVIIPDLNNDRKVDICDLIIVAKALGTNPSCPHGTGFRQWNPVADMNEDGHIDLRDLAIVAINYGATVP